MVVLANSAQHSRARKRCDTICQTLFIGYPLVKLDIRVGTLTHYTMLSTVAKSMFAFPATSVLSERVFSTAGDIITAPRAQ